MADVSVRKRLHNVILTSCKTLRNERIHNGKRNESFLTAEFLPIWNIISDDSTTICCNCVIIEIFLIRKNRYGVAHFAARHISAEVHTVWIFCKHRKMEYTPQIVKFLDGIYLMSCLQLPVLPISA